MELKVIEDYTQNQAFSVFGISITQSTSSQFGPLILAFLQHFAYDGILLTIQLSKSLFIYSFFATNMAVFLSVLFFNNK